MSFRDINLPVTFTEFTPGYCFRSYDQFGNDVARNLIVTLPGTVTPWNYGPNQPGNSVRDRPWLVTDEVTGAPVNGGTVTWSPAYGRWVSVYPTPSGTGIRMIWVGSLSELENYDGGEPGTVSEVTGPFWERDTALNDLVPIGVGTTIATVGTSTQVFDDATPGDPKLVGVYFIKRTCRLYRTFS